MGLLGVSFRSMGMGFFLGALSTQRQLYYPKPTLAWVKHIKSWYSAEFAGTLTGQRVLVPQ